MLFDRNDDFLNDRIIYQAKPNIIFGCKKAIFGAILLVIVLMLSPMVIKFVGNMQEYLISRINLPLTRYTAIAFFVIILIIIIYIIWQLVGWYSREYILTESKIIIKSGVLSTKKNYMPYATIQDINTSQSIIARLFGVGTISLFSAYDNNKLELSNIGEASKVEEVIFSYMVNSRNIREPLHIRYQQQPHHQSFERDIQLTDDYYDEFEPITPIGHEKNMSRREYEYYSEDLSFDSEPRNRYEYEPYDDRYYERANGMSDDDYIIVEHPQNPPSHDSYYNEVRQDYSYGGGGNYQNRDAEVYYNDDVNNISQDNATDVDDISEKVIKRHFDKFKK